MHLLFRTLIWQISFCNDIKWIKKPSVSLAQKLFFQSLFVMFSPTCYALVRTLEEPLWILIYGTSAFTKAALEREKHRINTFFCLLLFSLNFGRVTSGPRWLRATFIWSDTVSLGISDHFHTPHNIRALLFVKQQMRLMPSSGEEFNIIR